MLEIIFEAAKCEVDAPVLNLTTQSRHEILLGEVIMIEEDHIFPPRGFESRVACRRLMTVDTAFDELEISPAVLQNFLSNFDGVVSRDIVNHDNFEIFVILLND